MDYQDKLMDNQWKTSTLIIKIVGFVLISVIWFFGIALSFVLWRNDQRELAIVTSLIATLGNAVSLCIGVLIPSPLQGHRQADVKKDQPDDATGKPSDPVYVAPAPTPGDPLQVAIPTLQEPATTASDFAPLDPEAAKRDGSVETMDTDYLVTPEVNTDAPAA